LAAARSLCLAIPVVLKLWLRAWGQLYDGLYVPLLINPLHQAFFEQRAFL